MERQADRNKQLEPVQFSSKAEKQNTFVYSQFIATTIHMQETAAELTESNRLTDPHHLNASSSNYNRKDLQRYVHETCNCVVF